jgi:nitroreductase/NAD-dependent dihydropyrimidine dehydrogenase PreA subunit
MSFLTVDKNQCKNDGVCAEVCPIKIIRMDKAKHLPVLVDGGEKACIACGHCVSACPHGAISVEPQPVSECIPLVQGWSLTPKEVEFLLKGRRSIREYKDTGVERGLIEKLIDIARYAPSGVNRQPVNWAIIHDTEKVHRLAELVIEWMRSLIKEGSQMASALRMPNLVKAWEDGEDWICRNAPHLVISYSLKEDMTAPQACTIAMTYLELAAVSYGLGACWAGYVQMALNASDEVRKIAELSPKTDCFGAMMLGYPKINYRSIPLRKKPHVIWR